MDSKKITVQDIARIAGVDRASVSRALNDKPGVSAETKKRILEIAESHGYQRNPVISSLMYQLRQSQKTTYQATLGILITTPKNEWRQHLSYGLLYDGFVNASKALGYETESFYANDIPKLDRIFHNRIIRGLIIFSPPQQRLQFSLDWDKIYAITLQYGLQRPHIDRFGHHLYDGMQLALKTCLKKKYQRPAFIWHSESESRLNNASSSAFLVFQRDHPELDCVPLLHSKFETDTFTKASFESWLQRYQPDLIISSATTCEFIYKWKKKEIPRQFGLVTLDYETMTSPVSGIFQNHQKIGETAATHLISKVEHNSLGLPEFPSVTYIRGEWVESKTTRDG